jgi:phospholipid-translocating ATPase
VYAGHETKAMLNNSGSRYKRSYLEQKMNIDVVWCVIILILLCAVGAIGCNLWLSEFTGINVPYLISSDTNYPRNESVLMFFRLVIILQVFSFMKILSTCLFCCHYS